METKIKSQLRTYSKSLVYMRPWKLSVFSELLNTSEHYLKLRSSNQAKLGVSAQTCAWPVIRHWSSQIERGNHGNQWRGAQIISIEQHVIWSKEMEGKPENCKHVSKVRNIHGKCSDSQCKSRPSSVTNLLKYKSCAYLPLFSNPHEKEKCPFGFFQVAEHRNPYLRRNIVGLFTLLPACQKLVCNYQALSKHTVND